MKLLRYKLIIGSLAVLLIAGSWLFYRTRNNVTSFATCMGVLCIQSEFRDWLWADFAKASSSHTLDFAEARLVVRRADLRVRPNYRMPKDLRKASEGNRGFRVNTFLFLFVERKQQQTNLNKQHNEW